MYSIRFVAVCVQAYGSDMACRYLLLYVNDIVLTASSRHRQSQVCLRRERSQAASLFPPHTSDALACWLPPISSNLCNRRPRESRHGELQTSVDTSGHKIHSLSNGWPTSERCSFLPEHRWRTAVTDTNTNPRHHIRTSSIRCPSICALRMMDIGTLSREFLGMIVEFSTMVCTSELPLAWTWWCWPTSTLTGLVASIHGAQLQVILGNTWSFKRQMLVRPSGVQTRFLIHARSRATCSLRMRYGIPFSDPA